MSKRLKCPNCGANVAGHPDNACVLGAFIQIVREREGMTERKVRQLHAETDVDSFWDDVGPIIDKLEAGDYSL